MKTSNGLKQTGGYKSLDLMFTYKKQMSYDLLNKLTHGQKTYDPRYSYEESVTRYIKRDSCR